MAFLDSSTSAADDADSGPPSPGGGPPGPPGGGPSGPPGAGGGPVLAALANRQRGPQVSAPGRGDIGQSMGLIMHAYGFLKQAMVSLPPGSPIEQDIGKTLMRLGKHLPQGQPGLGIQQTQLQDMLRNVMKNALLAKIMGQQKPPGPGGGAGPPGAEPPGAGKGPPGAMAQAPMPSTPLPGA